MSESRTELNGKVALITGGAHRIGAQISTLLHQQGMNVVVHYHRSEHAALNLVGQFNQQRPHSAAAISANLLDLPSLHNLILTTHQYWQRLDVLVNNASTFYATPLAQTSENQWLDLLGTNLKAPFFLIQAAHEFLKQSQGNIVNIVDIHAHKPLKGYPVYSIAKAGLVMLTKAMARELGPEVRVNAIAPGAILWPEQALDDATQKEILSRTTLKRCGNPMDIATAALFLIRDAHYTTGHVLTVDGGRSLSQ